MPLTLSLCELYTYLSESADTQNMHVVWSIWPVKNKTMIMFLFVIVLTFSTFGTVCGVSTTDYKNLQKTLMTNYSNKVRPVQDQDDTVYVMTSFILADLNDVDAVQQRLVTTAYLRIVWIDEFLQWDKYTTDVERLYFKQVICCSYLSVKKKPKQN